MSWIDLVRARSFAHLYMAEPTDVPLPPHLVWQAPFVLASASDDLKRRANKPCRLQSGDLRYRRGSLF